MTFRGACESRRNNLYYLLDQLCLDSTLEIILIEQDVTSQLKIQPQPNFKHIFVETSGPFNKSWGLNIAAAYASCERMLFADADILISSTALEEVKQQMDSGADAVKPYDVLIDLSEQESRQLSAQTAVIDIDRTAEQVNRKSLGQHPPFCGGVFAITRTLYELSGGMDERFEDWGGDDDAMSKRLNFFASKMTTLNDMAYHLWHKRDESTANGAPSYIRNLALLTMYYERRETFFQSVAQQDRCRNGSLTKYQKASEPSQLLYQNPLISCLCVTRGRVELLQRAIECFQVQSYPHKELVIVCEGDDRETLNFLHNLDGDAVRHHIVPVEPKKSLGALRNLSIQLAEGEFICTVQ